VLRAVFLLLGGVLLLPYALGVGVISQLIVEETGSRAGVLAIALVAVVIALTPPFLAGTRELEIAAARALLGVDLPGHDRARRPALETRLRSALWFALHLASGGLVGLALLIAVPLALLAFTERLGLTAGALGPLTPAGRWWWTLAGVGLLVVTVAGTAGLGRLAATMAPVLLGPSPAERLAELHARELRLAERNRLARELHDSVGHALTAMTLQAGAARAVFDADPAFARQALGAIEETGRSAAEELDAVLGILRDEEPALRPAPTLDDLDRLLTGAVRARVAEVGVPAPVSREAFRIVQEALTNAARHGDGPADLTVRQDGEELMIEVRNRRAVTPGDDRGGGGHGIDGIHERVRLLGGRVDAGPDGPDWRLAAWLPLGPR
jgi:signal transduction histidine kinase